MNSPARIFRPLILALVAGGMLLVSPLAMQPVGRPVQEFADVDGRPAAAGEVLVKFRRTLAASERAQLEQQLGADANHAVGSAGVRRIHSKHLDARALMAFLRSHPDVEYVEPNYQIQSDATPNDVWFGQLWGLRNIGQVVGKAGTPGADISATSAWDISTGSRATVVAVIDTGIDYTHSDLAPNVWTASAPFSVTINGTKINCAAGTHGFNAITNLCEPFDDNGHGTHVSGTIGAVGNNGSGVVGVNWTTTLMASKFLDVNGTGTTANAINAIEFVIQAAAATG